MRRVRPTLGSIPLPLSPLLLNPPFPINPQRIFHPPQPGVSNSGRQAGAALLIVLSMLLLIGVIIIGFFARSVSFRKASASEHAAGTARKLAETAVNLVQAQIDHATTASGTAGEPKTAWASQPGAIRLYDDTGALKRIYRLYSATALTGSAVGELANDQPVTDWDKQPARWVDLNAPTSILTASGTTWRFPIADPAGIDTSGSNGFTASSTAGITITTGTGDNRRLPMPVRWLYVLKQGQILAPDIGTGSILSFSGATKPSKQNPIIGRIAFWTDDETCKVNLNTAGGSAKGSEGIFWDTPRFSTQDEWNFGMFQPRAKEYQRYPGHPATTTLSKVFPDLSSEQLLALTPRYTFGGSTDGTVSGTTALTPKTGERLYPSVGELFFDKDRNPTGLDPQRLESSRFLLTANNRSPELTLYGTPRVCIWPIHSNTSKRTTTDKLLAFVAQTGTGSASANYCFTRQDPTSTTTDINIDRNNKLLNYLDALTSGSLGGIPGFGGSFSDKYSDKCRHDILVKIFDYIRCTNLADTTLASSTNQYAYDSVNRRSTDNLVAPAIHTAWGVQGFGRFPVVSEVSLWFIALGSGTNTTTAPAKPAIPLHPSQVGARVPVGSEWLDATLPANNHVAVQAFLLLSYFTPSQGCAPALYTLPAVRMTGLDSLKITISGTTYPLGFASDIGYQSNAVSLNSMDGGGALPGANSFKPGVVSLVSGTYSSAPLGSGSSGAIVTATNPFYSNILSVSGSSMKVSGAATLEVYDPSAYDRLKKTTYAADKKIFSIPLDFNQFTQMPMVTGTTTASFGLPLTIVPADKKTANDRAQLFLSSPTIAIKSGDVLWSLVPNFNNGVGEPLGGDYRMLYKPVLAASAFVQHSALPATGTGPNLAFSAPYQRKYLSGATLGGKLVADATYDYNAATKDGCYPGIPAGLNGVYAGSCQTGSGLSLPVGDWDNGIAESPDGPFINRADEGSIDGLTTGTNPYFAGNFWFSGDIGTTLFSPNRLLPSAGMFGSISTGVQTGRPWQTLLFRPGPTGHLGSQSPKDHLLLDLFWMPVAEPYAISEPFSTNGKANLNYQIQPFTYIKRSTALLSALASERVAKVGKGNAAIYKKDLTTSPAPGTLSTARLPLNLSGTDGTLRQFEEKFAANDLFKSASEICDIFLVPEGSSWTDDNAARAAWYGDDFALVGDNVRERPYANLLGRVTTKSNTFTVYYTVQALKNPITVSQDQWDETRGVVLSEFRGSTTLERYIDPNSSITDYAKTPAAQNLDNYYNWRIIQNSQFAP